MMDLLSRLLNKIDKLETDLEEVKQLMAISEADFTLLNNRVIELEKNFRTLSDEVHELNTNLTEQITTNATSVNESIVSLEQNDTAMSETITLLQSADTNAATVISELQSSNISLTELLQTTIQRLQQVETQQLSTALNALSLEKTKVTEDLVLPQTDIYGNTINWASSDESVLTSTGVITQPSYTDGDKEVTLTATLTYGDVVKTKEFVLTIPSLSATDLERVNADKEILNIDSFDEDSEGIGIQLTTSKVMPTNALLFNSVIEWNSDDEAHFAPDGTVTRPAYGEENVDVLLTATLTNGTAEATKAFLVTVLADTEQPTTEPEQPTDGTEPEPVDGEPSTDPSEQSPE